MIETLQNFAASFPEWLQGLAIVLVAAVPFVESYFGGAIGVIIGIHPLLALLFAVIGNGVSMAVLVLLADKIRNRPGREPKPETPRRAKLRRAFDKWGVPGVSLLGQSILPSQITSMAMVGFGASTRQVITWQIVSIILWGAAFTALATAGVAVIG